LHVKSKVYYVQKDGDPRQFRKIEDDDDPIVKKMKQSEEMRKAIQSTEFVKFDESGNPANQEDGVPIQVEEAVANAQKAPGPEPKPLEPEKEEDQMSEGKVQKWDAEKGFGFIVPLRVQLDEDKEAKALFVHRKNVVGSTPTNPINLKEGGKVQYKPGEQDGRQCANEVMMLGSDGKPLPLHLGAQTLEEKKKSYYVSAESLGLRVHAESWPGLKKTLQDRYVSDEAMEELGVYFGVFDGHGGTQVADHAAKQLHKNIMMQFRQKQVQPASRDEKIRQAIKEAFLQTDKEICSTAERKKFEQVGSTAVCALLHGNPKLGTALRLVVPNLGDSRAVLCRAGVAVAASEDHKPSRVDEKKRIERAGGLVLQVRGAWRVAASTNPNSNSKSSRREYQGLAMTRSLGDLYFKKPVSLASAEPEIQIIPLTDKDLFLVLATDGIFDVLQNQEVVDLALKHWEDPDEAAKTIVRTAYKKGSEDNLTVLVIQFGWADKNVQKYVSKGRGTSVGGAMDLGGSSKPDMAVDAMDMFG
jgi:protein phosphatase 1L